MIWGGLPNYAAEVQNIINKTSATYLQQNDGSCEYIDKRRDELVKLRDEIADSETTFFECLGIKGKSPGQALQELQERIEAIERANSELSIDNLQREIFNDPGVITTLDDISLTAISNAIGNIKWTFEDMTGESENNFYDYIINKLSDLIVAEEMKHKGKKGQTVFEKGYFSHIIGQGLKRILNITRLHDEKDYFKIEIKADQSVSTELKLKLLNAIRKYTNTKTAETQQEFKDVVTNKLLSITNSTTLMGACIRHEITVNADKYDLSRNISSLKGFIQEVWTNAMMSTLMGKVGATMPTGNIHSTLGSRGEIPVDMVLQDFNFQIKSYNLVNGKYEIHSNNKSIGTFIKDRAQMNESDLLLEFFGSYQFNQPFRDKDLVERYENTPMPVDVYENQIYNRFDELSKQMDPLFQSYVDKIIRIDSTFQGDRGPLFATEKLYFNTFFIVNNKVVPASVMLEAIIESLDAARDEDLIKFEQDKIKPTEGVNTLESIILSSKRKKRYSGSVLDVADLVKISYTIFLDFDKVLTTAYNLAIRYGINN